MRFREKIEPIKVGSLRVFPHEVDQVLLAHPDVAHALTFPIPDAKFGESIGAAVVLREGAIVQARELKWFAFTHLASHKIPHRMVMLESIPMVERSMMAEALGWKPAGGASSVFCIQPGEGAPLYVVGAQREFRIRSQQPVWGIREPDLAQLPPPHTVEHVAAECVHALRRFQPEGPYRLGAADRSRSVALEMARQLEQAGERIEFVALLGRGEFNGPQLRYDRRHSWTGRMVDMSFAGA